jgi:hypothetical protein
MTTRTSAGRDLPGRSSRAAAPLAAAVVLGSILVACEGEQRAVDRPKTIVVDDFESGALAGWQAVGSGSGAWFAYSDGQVPPDPAQSDPNAPFFVPDPPQGGFAAVTDMNGPGTRILYRDVALDGRFALHLTVFYIGKAPFSTSDTLAFESPEPNQQFRIDLIDPTAPIDSVAEGDVLVNVFPHVHRRSDQPRADHGERGSLGMGWRDGTSPSRAERQPGTPSRRRGQHPLRAYRGGRRCPDRAAGYPGTD